MKHEAVLFIAEEYAKMRNFDVEKCKALVLYYKHKFEKKRERKNSLKALLGRQ